MALQPLVLGRQRGMVTSTGSRRGRPFSRANVAGRAGKIRDSWAAMPMVRAPVREGLGNSGGQPGHRVAAARPAGLRLDRIAVGAIF